MQKDIAENRKKNLTGLSQQTEAVKIKENEIFYAERRLALINAENLKYFLFSLVDWLFLVSRFQILIENWWWVLHQECSSSDFYGYSIYCVLILLCEIIISPALINSVRIFIITLWRWLIIFRWWLFMMDWRLRMLTDWPLRLMLFISYTFSFLLQNITGMLNGIFQKIIFL